ncbi:MAG: hypothetical protein HYW05_02835 [Candidatus Diapherotrites archaeon]|nr:hypothetical protein [Candidatus Diapherotrites archaeon]
MKPAIKSQIPVLAFITIIFAILLSGCVNVNKAGDCKDIKSVQERDSCYHSLAHANDDSAICKKIEDKLLKEHCITHIEGE